MNRRRNQMKDVIASYSHKERKAILLNLLERMIETEEIGFRKEDDEEPGRFYWSSSGDDLRETK